MYPGYEEHSLSISIKAYTNDFPELVLEYDNGEGFRTITIYGDTIFKLKKLLNEKWPHP